MISFDWVMSEGGPLIFMETKLASSWEGVSALSVVSDGAENDYDRACSECNFLDIIPLLVGKALVFGELTANTSFWRSVGGPLLIVQVCTEEEGVDFDLVMRGLGNHVFDDPRGSLDFHFASPDLILFDSAERGSETAKDSITASIAPGHYRILTQTYDDPTCSLVLHRFDAIA